MKSLTLITTISLSTALVACGGSGDSGGSNVNNVKPLGAYTGSTSRNQEVDGIVDNKNQLWMVYRDNNDSRYAGLIIGNLNIDGAKVATAAKDFNFIDQSLSNITVMGTIREGMTFNGTAKQSNGSLTFNTTFDNNASTDKATYELIKGTYTGEAFAINKKGNASFSIDGSGKLISKNADCKYTGSLKPFNSKKVTYYEVVVKFPNTSSCLLPNTTVTGVGGYDNKGELYILAKNSDMSQVLLAKGNKQ